MAPNTATPIKSNSGGSPVFRYNFAQISWVTISSSFYGHDAVFLFFFFFLFSFLFFCIYTQTSRPSCFLSKFKVRWSGSCAAVSNPSWIWQSGSLRAASILVSSSIHFLYLRTASFFTPPDTLSHLTQQCSHHSHCFFACFILLLWLFRISSLFPASVLAGCFSCLALFLSVYPFLTHIGTPSHPILWSSCSSSMLFRVSRLYFPSFSFSFHSERDHCVLLSFLPPSSTAFVFSFLVGEFKCQSFPLFSSPSWGEGCPGVHVAPGPNSLQQWIKPSCSGAKRGLRMTMTCTSSVGSRCLPTGLILQEHKGYATAQLVMWISAPATPRASR